MRVQAREKIAILKESELLISKELERAAYTEGMEGFNLHNIKPGCFIEADASFKTSVTTEFNENTLKSDLSPCNCKIIFKTFADVESHFFNFKNGTLSIFHTFFECKRCIFYVKPGLQGTPLRFRIKDEDTIYLHFIKYHTNCIKISTEDRDYNRHQETINYKKYMSDLNIQAPSRKSSYFFEVNKDTSSAKEVCTIDIVDKNHSFPSVPSRLYKSFLYPKKPDPYIDKDYICPVIEYSNVDEPPQKLEFCGNKLATTNYFGPQLCHLCGKFFESKWILNKHINYVHENLM